jgi:hypothetical protein
VRGKRGVLDSGERGDSRNSVECGIAVGAGITGIGRIAG